eukprot:m.22761 g.22761  ORF g.22761 m.22761 type:complete len:100 (-) comp5477_c0_seq5:1656-1955(-)
MDVLEILEWNTISHRWLNVSFATVRLVELFCFYSQNFRNVMLVVVFDCICFNIVLEEIWNKDDHHHWVVVKIDGIVGVVEWWTEVMVQMSCNKTQLTTK